MSIIRLKNKGFTFVEVMLVVTILAVISTLVLTSVQYVRISGRDARRISDINQIRNALNLYYSKYSQYPTEITPGQDFQVGSIMYLNPVPSNPTPFSDNSCGDKNYDYTQTSSGLSYTLSFCLGYNQGDITAGEKIAIPEGIVHKQ